jgi:hypothetical protein
MARYSTHHNTPALARPHEWLVLVGPECKERWVTSVNFPNEANVRRELRIGSAVDILIGRP